MPWEDGSLVGRTPGQLEAVIDARMDAVQAELAAAIAVAVADASASVVGELNVRSTAFAGGAKGDGTTDDTAAIQAAINAAANAGGGVVLIPAGVYITTTLRLKSNVMIRGAGAPATTVRQKAGFVGDLLMSEGFEALTGTIPAGDVAGINNWHLREIMFDGNKANGCIGWVMRVFGAAYTIDHVEFWNGKLGGCYSEWRTTTGGRNMESFWSNFKIKEWSMGTAIVGTDASGGGSWGLMWKGPHDGIFVNGVVATLDSLIRPGSTPPSIGIQTAGTVGGFNGGAAGEMFVNVHVWGRCHYGFYTTGGAVFYSNCEAEGAFTVNVLLTTGSVWMGGTVYGNNGANGTNEVGFQLGKTIAHDGFDENCGRCVIEGVVTNNWNVNGAPLSFISVSGQNRLRIAAILGSCPQFYTGPAPYYGADHLELICHDHQERSIINNPKFSRFGDGVSTKVLTAPPTAVSGNFYPNFASVQSPVPIDGAILGESSQKKIYMLVGGAWRAARLRLDTEPQELAGPGDPEGVVTATVGSTYQRSDGGVGTSFYVKEVGSGNTGWAVPAGGGGGPAAIVGTGLTQGRKVVGAPQSNQYVFVAPNTIFLSRRKATARCDMSGIRFEFGGPGATTDISGDNEVLVQAALELASGVIIPMTFNGNEQGNMGRTGWLVSDAAQVDLLTGDDYYIRARVIAPNHAGNLNPLAGYCPLSADVAIGATSVVVTALPPVIKTPMRMRLAGPSAEMVEIIRWTGTGPWTAILRKPTVAAHTVALSYLGQGTWGSSTSYSDRGSGSSSAITFDLYADVFTPTVPSAVAVLSGAAAIGDTEITVTGAYPPGEVFTLDTAGNAETVTARTVTGLSSPYKIYLTAPLTKVHASGVNLAATVALDAVVVPTVVTADYSTSPPASIILIGDSIAQGTGNPGRVWEGWATLALTPTHAVLNCTKGGESALQFKTNTLGTGPSLGQRRGMLGVTDWMIYAYGANDVYGASNLAAMQASTRTICGWARERGLKIAIATITPRTTSTDGWETVGGQTVVNSGTSNLYRKQYNDWVRAGADGYCDLLLDVADAVETARDTGLWKADTVTGPYTVDGLHPSITGHALMAAAVDPTDFT